MEDTVLQFFFSAFNQYLFVPKFDQALWVTNNKTSFPHFILNIAFTSAPLFSYFLPLDPNRHICPSNGSHIRFPRRRHKGSVFAPNWGQCPFISSCHKCFRSKYFKSDLKYLKSLSTKFGLKRFFSVCVGNLLTAFCHAQGIPVPEFLVHRAIAYAKHCGTSTKQKCARGWKHWPLITSLWDHVIYRLLRYLRRSGESFVIYPPRQALP
jgi:hypothetical protein